MQPSAEDKSLVGLFEVLEPHPSSPQHAVFFVTRIVAWFIPDVPRVVKMQMEREKFLTREVMFASEAETLRQSIRRRKSSRKAERPPLERTPEQEEDEEEEKVEEKRNDELEEEDDDPKA